MTTKEFVEKYYSFAKQCEDETGLSAVATLTQAALESGWGASIPGNMFFGIKADKAWTGKKQLLKTTEVFKSSLREQKKLLFTSGGRQLISVKENYKVKNGVSYDLFIVRTYFRAYDSPAECFKDHYDFFVKNTRYKDALAVKNDYNRFFEEIHEAGYATGVNYSNTLKGIATKIIPFIPAA